MGVGCRAEVLRPDEAVRISRFLHPGVGRVPRPGEKLCSNLARRNDHIDEVVWFTRDVVADVSVIRLRVDLQAI